MIFEVVLNSGRKKLRVAENRKIIFFFFEKEVRRKVLTKSKLVLHFVNNCKTHSAREAFVDALGNFTTIEQFGDCNARYCHSACQENAIGEKLESQ